MNLQWDPEIDTPATIAIIGGGSTGVEAALYARFLGYTVMLFDLERIGNELLRWRSQAMPGTWRDMTSPLGLAALEAQSGKEALPVLDDPVTYEQYVEKYLVPVAKTDLLYESMQINSKVVSVSRHMGGPSLSPEQASEREFRVLIDSQQRGEFTQLVDVVLDCSGLNRRASGMASGGGFSAGQLRQCESLLHGKVDVLGKKRSTLENREILLFGNDLAAGVNALDLSELADTAAETRLTWVIPKLPGNKPLELNLPKDRVGVELLHARLLPLTKGDNPMVTPIAAWGVESLAKPNERWQVRLQIGEEETLEIESDVVINCGRAVADFSFASAMEPRQLRTAGQFGNNNALDAAAGDASQPIAACLTTEPHYYVLGQKAAVPEQDYSMTQRLDSIRSAFSFIGGREDLNLYRSIRPSE